MTCLTLLLMLMLERTLFCFKTRNVPSLQCPVLASEVENEILHQSAAAVAATFVLVLPQAAFHHGFPFFSSASSNPYSHEHPAVKKKRRREKDQVTRKIKSTLQWFFLFFAVVARLVPAFSLVLVAPAEAEPSSPLRAPFQSLDGGHASNTCSASLRRPKFSHDVFLLFVVLVCAASELD